MSSDTFYIEIRAIQDDTVELLCTTSTAGGINDFALTRSFVLMALEDGMPYPGDNPTPLQRAMREIGGPTPPVWEEKFHGEHVDKFIASTELVERIGIVTDERAWQDGRFSTDDDKAFPSHQFVIRARMTDPRWLEGLTVGEKFGTTAFDAWWYDPVRPSDAQIAAVTAKASRWYPPGKKPATRKAPAAKSAAKKAAPAKKTAAKKTAAKKTAKKTAAKKTAAKKTTAKKTAAKKTAAKKTAAKKTPAKKTPAKKAPARKTAAKKSAKKSSATQAAARKKTARKRSS